MTRNTIEHIDAAPWASNRGGKVWAILFNTNQGRELFGTYDTKAEAKADAKEYGLKISA